MMLLLRRLSAQRAAPLVISRHINGLPAEAVTPISKPTVLYTGLFIDNEWRRSASGNHIDVINPANGETTAHVQAANASDVDVAVAAARKAFTFGSRWRRMDASQRGLLLYRLADRIERDSHYIASLETVDSGKPYHIVQHVDVPLCVSKLRYYAGYADKNHGKTIPMDGDYFAYTRHEPVGVCAQIIPWNFPLVMLAMKIAPALAAGCTVVLKPAEQTPLTALYVAQLCKDVGFPAGVVNVLPGTGPDAGAVLAAHRDVDKVAFTGSTEVGMRIQRMSGETNLKRVNLELGGKSALIVLPDADIADAVQQAHQAVFFNAGQVCCAGTRTFVHGSVYAEFVERSAALAEARIVGDPFDERTEQGPQVSEKQRGRVEELVQSGRDEGAEVVAGGRRTCTATGGYFLRPTVLAGVTDEMRVAREEIFGPVQSLLRFDEVDEAIERANASDYGLAGAVFTRNGESATRVAHALQTGTVWVNCYFGLAAQAPFGGYKQSGHGRENGEEGLRLYTEVKTVIARAPGRCS